MKENDPTIVNQILGAMEFWAQMSEKSKIHPSRLPGVSDYFKTRPPMTSGEIREWLYRKNTR